ncbi:MAG TPA: hypothetical protein VKP67_12395 [Xanthobacteraceae bacterium]|nr:hypothetical protein [Xanthobacteraceae bacterium]
MRSTFPAIVAVLMVGVATAALAQETRQTTQKPSYQTCEALALQRGAGHSQGSSRNPEDTHAAFMRQCQAGEIPQ